MLNFLENIARKVESSVSIYDHNQKIDLKKQKITLNQISVILGVVTVILMYLIDL